MIEQNLYNSLRETLVRLEAGGHAILQPFDLTVAYYDCLRLLTADEGQRLGELGKRLLIDNSKMTRIADHLTGRGLAERRRDAADRRAWLLFLTAAGAALREQAAAAHRAYLHEQLFAFDENERTQLTQLLDKLNQHLKNDGVNHD